ncbi:MAG: hypothetical protein HKN79_01350 [Flavobacteriales bacterium]|nr:hypothetical protein [Flavobacteriales bacterium]
MQMTIYRLSFLIIVFTCLVSCTKEDEDPLPSPDIIEEVSVDLDAVPYAQLSDYHFFQGALKDLENHPRVLPYDLISPLFTDYAKKSRFIWMPEGLSAEYSSDGQILDFPVGTVIIKTFYYDHVLPEDERKNLETRLLIHKEDGWIFAEYVWNDDQTEAPLDTQGDFIPVEFIDDNGVTRSIDYRLPSMDGGECLVCHKKDGLPIPIGPKPQNLNKLYDYTNGAMNQLDKWKEIGYLDDSTPIPSAAHTVVNWKNEALDLELRVRSYIDINCGHCHAEGSHCDYRPMRFAFSETGSEENLGICVEPDEYLGAGQTHIVSSGNIGRSMLYYRFSSTDEAVRMPLLGRSIVHDEALEMIVEWIESLDPPCD